MTTCDFKLQTIKVWDKSSDKNNWSWKKHFHDFLMHSVGQQSLFWKKNYSCHIIIHTMIIGDLLKCKADAKIVANAEDWS